jgi:hypothetical protein
VAKQRLRFVLCALFLLPGISLYAQTVSAVSLRGLKRTKPHVAEYPLQKFIGQEGSLLDFNEVHAAVAGTGILEPLSIGLELAPDRETLILVVEVREKWTFFPIPVFFVNSDGDMQGGGALMDANAFGLNDAFIAAGFYGSSGWLASLLYRYTPDRKGLPGWIVLGMYGRQNRKDTDQHKTELRNYEQRTIIGGLRIQYPATEYFTVSASFSLRDQRVDDGGQPRAVPDRGVFAAGIEPSLEITQSYWDGFLLSQRRAFLSYDLLLPKNNPVLQTFSFRGNYELSIVPGFKAGIRGGMRYALRTLPIFESSPASVGATILPNSFSAETFGAVSVDFEKYLHKFSQGTLAFLLSYQGVYSYGPILGHQFDHGVSAALNFYLSRIALPAIGLGASYNAAKNEYTAVFSIGMSF